MNKYNVGDVVKLRDDLEVGEKYGAEKLNEAMNEVIGKKAEIKDCYNDRYYAKFASRYGGCWLITEEMIEGLWEECKEKQDKLKLIDVLNMIAKGELKEGTKVRYKGAEFIYEDNELYDDDGDNICCYMCDRFDLTIEVELIEPPCEHEWLDWETHRMGEGRIRRYRRCNKCGLEEENDVGKPIEPSKIEELIDWYELPNGLTSEEKIHIVWNKLNEVIRKINNE